MNTSTPSQAAPESMTDGQIDKLTDNVRAALRKNRQRFSAANIQQALECGRLDAKVTAVVEAAVEQAIAEASNTIVCIVSKLDRNRTPQQVLDATGRRQYTDDSVVATMPSGGKGVEENVTVEFFKLGKYVSDDELAKAYEERGLTPDPYAQAAVNEADSAFADEHPNGTHWKDADGKWCFATFRRRDGERYVSVNRRGHGWDGHWWFGGVRK